MNQRLLLVLVFVLMLVSTAAAQYIIVGPPDDLTYIDTTYTPPGFIKPTPFMTSLGAMTSLPVDTVNITQLDCSLFPLICTYVEALDSLGRPIGGLTADSFCVYQDGILIGPGNFTVQELTIDSCITSICLVVDVSGSMTENNKINDAKNAMRRFVRNMDAYDRVAIVSFANTVVTVQTFTSDTTLLLSKINGLVASGNTACFDGIWQGVNVTVAELGSKAVIAFTDGLENRSHITPQPPNGVGSPATGPYTDDSTLICNFSNGAGIPIYTFNLGPITNTYYNTEAMEAFATGTSGFWRHAPSGSQIDSVYDEIKVRICSRYKICYTSLDTIQNGTIHVTKVCHKVGGNCVGCDEATCQEQAPPVIVRTPPTEDLSDTCQVRTNPLQICVNVTDLDTPPSSFTVRLFYRLVGSPGYPSYTDVQMLQQGGPNDSIFCYTVPANLLNCRTAFEYYITASDGQQTLSNPPVNPQSTPYSVAICPNLPPTVACVPDTTMFVCSLAQICLTGFNADDPDGNLATTSVSVGTILEDQVCFTPVVGPNILRVIAVDSCGLADTCTTTVNVVLNSAPIVSCHADTTVAFCGPGQVCIDGFVATDVDNNIVTKTTSLGTLTGSTICFNAPTAGVYNIRFIAIDACGKADTCFTNVTVTLNSPPVVNCHADTSMFVCSLAQICLSGYSATDPDNNIVDTVVTGGTLVGNQVCFTPVAGVNTIRVVVTDACGAADTCITNVNVTVNAPPDAVCHADTTIFVCSLAQICLPGYTATDPNSNLTSVVLTGGTLMGNQACFIPVVGVNVLKLVATDACGAQDSCITNVTVALNNAPVATCPGNSPLFVCNLNPICVGGFSATDSDGNLGTVTVNTGTFNGSQVCFTPVVGPNLIRLIANDACGKADTCETTITVALNSAPNVTCHGDTSMFMCAPAQVCLNGFVVTDPDNNVSTVSVTGGTLTGNQVCFTPVAGVNTIRVIATDACGKADTCQTQVTVAFDSPPDAVCPGTTNVFVCNLAPICVPGFSATDVDGNLSSVVASPGSLSGNMVCFTPVAGANTIRLIATDACGKADTCFTTVNVELNDAPIVSCHSDTTIFACSLAQICLPGYSATDPNDNLNQVTVTGGTLNGSQVCFTPVVGMNTITLTATDDCGLVTQCVTNVTVILNSPPVIACPNNTAQFVCNLNQICIPGFSATDPDNNIVTYQVTGGSIQGNTLCFTPVVGPNVIKVIATDACGAADTCQTTVTVTLNTPPTANAGADQNLNCRTAGVPICWNVSASDPDAGVPLLELISPVGSLVSNQICFSPVASGLYTFILKASDGCGAVDLDTAVITVRLNTAPQLALDGSDTSIACLDDPPVAWCVPFTYSDAESNVRTLTVTGLPGAVLNYSGGNGTVCFTPPSVTAQYQFTLSIEDSCGLVAQAQHQHLVALVDCDTATCFAVEVEKTHNSMQGQYEFVSIYLQSDALEFGGFDFLIKYDNSGLSFIDAQPGALLNSCAWEYFTYRYGAVGNCGGPCPSGLIRIVALADANNGSNHPLCFGAGDDSPHEVAILKFLVTNDRTFECQYLPIGFFWVDCGDNAISTVTGDTLYLDKRIYTFDGQLVWDELNDVSYPDASRPFGVGARDWCLIGDKYHALRCVEFTIGGIDVICADSIDANGDLNLNGLAYEIADAVLYTNYFLYGLAALDSDPQRREAQIAASDVNQDGTPLSVADLVYLTRVIVGDALPFPKLAPFANTVDVKWQNGRLITGSNTPIGALLAKFRVTGDYKLNSTSNMQLMSAAADGEVTVLVYSGLTDMRQHLAAGTNEVLQTSGELELLEVQVSDYEGNLVSVNLSKSSLPENFALHQNRPNPFNPVTQIELELPVASDWKIEVLNITGQLVKTLSGTGIGRVVAEWDGSGAPSGVYFYRASAGAFTETRKMVLLK